MIVSVSSKRWGCKSAAEAFVGHLTDSCRLKNARKMHIFLSDFSGRPCRNLPRRWVIHMATRRPAHNTLINIDFLCVFFCKGPKSMWIGVLWAGLRVAMWIAHVHCKFRHGLLEKALILGTEKYLPPPPREQEKKIFRGKLWLHPTLR